MIPSTEEKEELTASLNSVVSQKQKVSDEVLFGEFPNGYADLLGLLERQRVALVNLLAGKDLGCTLESLALDQESMLARPHLDNLAFVAHQAKQMPLAEQDDFIKAQKMILHDLRNNAGTAANFAHGDIKAFIQAHARVLRRVDVEGKREL